MPNQELKSGGKAGRDRPRNPRSKKKSRGNEFVGLLIFAYAVLLLLSLVTYDPLDPGWDNSVPHRGQKVHNLIGEVGSYLASFVFFLFGFSSFLIPAGLVAVAWIAFRDYPVRAGWAKGIGFAMGVTSLSGLFWLCLGEVRLGTSHAVTDGRGGRWSPEIDAGGYLGRMLNGTLVQLFGTTGTSIVLLTTFVLSACLVSRLSPATIVDTATLVWTRFSRVLRPHVGRLSTWARERFERLGASGARFLSNRARSRAAARERARMASEEKNRRKLIERARRETEHETHALARQKAADARPAAVNSLKAKGTTGGNPAPKAPDGAIASRPPARTPSPVKVEIEEQAAELPWLEPGNELPDLDSYLARSGPARPAGSRDTNPDPFPEIPSNGSQRTSASRKRDTARLPDEERERDHAGASAEDGSGTSSPAVQPAASAKPVEEPVAAPALPETPAAAAASRETIGKTFGEVPAVTASTAALPAAGVSMAAVSGAAQVSAAAASAAAVPVRKKPPLPVSAAVQAESAAETARRAPWKSFPEEAPAPVATSVPPPAVAEAPRQDDSPVKAASKKSRLASGPGTSSAKRTLSASEAAFARQDTKPFESAFHLPPTTLLAEPDPEPAMEDAELIENAQTIVAKFREFAVNGSVKLPPIRGPVVTTYEYQPEAGVKYSRLLSLTDDLAMALKAEAVRIDRLPGKSAVGIEVPNRVRETIYLKTILESDAFQASPSLLTLALGQRINGEICVTDLARMPHLLIAGATGSGKSVAVNSMLVSILYRCTPEEVKLILVDPKRIELGIYADLPHLLVPVVTEPKNAASALRWAVLEMENRYRRLAMYGVRNIDQFNETMESGEVEPAPDDDQGLARMPFLVIIIDEFADLMMTTPVEVEESVARLAAMARAVGIHLILATQRPSVDVITGVIKANFPSRISFRVSSKIDSRTILDANGAELLLGGGDMLFLPPGRSRLIRIHGAYVSEKEVTRLVTHLKSQKKPVYNEAILKTGQEPVERGEIELDTLYEEAARLVVESGQASISHLQRRLRLGYSRAARLIDMMEMNGLIGPKDGSRVREVLVDPTYFDRPAHQRQ